MFGRDAQFQRVEIDGSYPEYLLAHLEEYQYLVMPPISRGRQAATRISMMVKRFFRKAVRRVRRFAGSDV